MATQIRQSEADESPLLVRVDGFGRMASIVRLARLDLDEDDRATVDGYQVELTKNGTVAACHDFVAAEFQVACRGRLAPLSERTSGDEPR